MGTVFPVSAVSWKALLFILVMSAVPGAITYFAMKAAGGTSNGAMAAIISVLVLPIFAFLFVQLFFVKVAVSPKTLQVGGGLYEVNVPLAEIRANDIVTVAPGQSPPRIDARTNGIGMPGLRLGWFIGGGRKLFVATGRSPTLVVIPTDLDYDLIVAPDNPERFVLQLRRLAASKR